MHSRQKSFKDVHIDLKVGPIQLKLAEGTKFGVWNSLLTNRIMSDEKPIILKFTGLSVFSRIFMFGTLFSEPAAKITS